MVSVLAIHNGFVPRDSLFSILSSSKASENVQEWQLSQKEILKVYVSAHDVVAS